MSLKPRHLVCLCLGAKAANQTICLMRHPNKWSEAYFLFRALVAAVVLSSMHEFIARIDG